MIQPFSETGAFFVNTIKILIVEPDEIAFQSLLDRAQEAFPDASIDRLFHNDASSLDVADLVLCVDRPGEIDAADVILAIHSQHDLVPVIVLLDDPGAERIYAAINAGAADCFPVSELTATSLRFRIEKCLTMAKLQQDSLRLHAGLTRSLAELVQRNRKLGELAGRLEMMASTDPLTQLNNRWWLKQRLDAMFAVAARYGSDLACMMIDLDNFKLVNDHYGHLKGDEVLTLTGELIRTEIRASDIAARYGGDEFVILMPRTNAKTALSLAARLQKQFDRRVRQAADVDVDCTMCAGVACMSISRPGAPEVLIRHADTALYAAKDQNRNCTMICSSDGATPVDAHHFAA